jgi:hypothetical protein
MAAQMKRKKDDKIFKGILFIAAERQKMMTKNTL